MWYFQSAFTHNPGWTIFVRFKFTKSTHQLPLENITQIFRILSNLQQK